MGSEATLHIGKIRLDYDSNQLTDHSALFRPEDLGVADYVYVDDEDEDEHVVESREAYTCALRDVLPRLELLGVTIESLRRSHDGRGAPFGFDVLAEAFLVADLHADPSSRSFHYDPQQAISEVGSAVAAGVGFERADKYDDALWELLDGIDPRGALRLLAANPANLDVPVVWRFADIVEGGWVARNEVHHAPATREQFLIVTEGSTDANVLKKALRLRRPRVADFFYFVDMTENYPFSGTGNLFNFSKGLARIRIENRVIVLYDNDAEGTSKLQASLSLNLPSNIRAIGLPPLGVFTEFVTKGPTGEALADINGKAAAIECYLDLTYGTSERPIVRWTNFQANSGTYQGAIADKDRYTKLFLDLRPGEEDSYDFRKLDAVLDAIISVAVDIASLESSF